MNLTERQKKAVDTPNRSAAIIAGAGSGKTEVLTRRLICILENGETSLNQILAITFTEKAAAELKKRIAAKLPPEQKEELPWAAIQTFHSFCFDVLRGEAPSLGLSDNLSIWDDPTSRLAIYKHCRQTLLESLESRDPETLLLLETLEFRHALILFENLMQDRWYYKRMTKHQPQTSELEKNVADLFEKMNAAYTVEKNEKQVLDFQDLEILTLQLLKEEKEIRIHLQKRFRYLFVDEVQDVNDLQKELLEQLFDPNRNTLCIVGDPKQSIYRFRGANVENYSKLVDRIIEAGGEKIELQENFRSEPKIVEWVNHLFKNEEPLIPTIEPGETPNLKLLPVVIKDGDSKENSREAEATAIADWISQEVHLQKRSFGDFALLFQTLSQVRIYTQALQAASIPYRLSGGGGFLNSQEVLDLLFVLKLMVNIEDRMALIGLMRSPLIGFDDVRITETALQHPDDLGAALLKTDEAAWLGKLWATRHDKNAATLLEETLWATGFDHFLYQCDPSFSANGNVEHLIELVRKLELTESFSLSELLNYFEELKKRKTTLNQSGIQDTDGKSLLLTTVHAAKGLEFPVVILPDLVRGNPPLYSRVFFSRQHGIGFAKKEEESPFAKYTFDEKTEGWITLEKEEALKEKKRLLYVALTRAQQTLVIPDIPDAKRTGPWYSWVREGITTFPEWEKILLSSDRKEITQIQNLKIEDFSVVAVPKWKPEIHYLTVTGLSPQKKMPLFRKEGQKSGLDGAKIGDLVHAVLKNIHHPETDDLEALFKKHLFQLEIDLPPEELNDIQCWVAAFLKSDAAPPRWDGEHEFPFRLQIRNCLISGVVDYLWEESDGFVLCDFKTDKNPDPKKYRQQLNFYALALSKRLPKPVKETRILFLRSQRAHIEPVDMSRLCDAERELDEIIRNCENDHEAAKEH